MNVKQTTNVILLLTAASLLVSGLSAQDQETKTQSSAFSLKGTHQLTLTAGVLTESNNGDDQGIASFEYNYWFSEHAAISVSSTAIASEWDDDDFEFYCNNDDDAVVSFMVGMQLRPEFFNISNNVFLTLEGKIGTYIAIDEYSYYDWDDHRRHDTDTESKFGAYVGLNLNIAVSRRFMVGVSAGYHFVEEFDTPINGERDYKSPDVRVRFSLLL